MFRHIKINKFVFGIKIMNSIMVSALNLATIYWESNTVVGELLSSPWVFSNFTISFLFQNHSIKTSMYSINSTLWSFY